MGTLLVLTAVTSYAAVENLKISIGYGVSKKVGFKPEVEGMLRDFGVTVLPSEDSYKVAINKLSTLMRDNNKEELETSVLKKLHDWNAKIKHTIQAKLTYRADREHKFKKHRVKSDTPLSSEQADYLID